MSTEAEHSGGGRRGAGKGREGPRSTEELAKLFDRLPPNSPSAEMALLGSMLLDPMVVGDVLTIIESPDAFYTETHTAIFEAIRDVYDKRQSGDIVQISQLLEDRGALDSVGGPEYLVELAEGVPSSANAPHFARIVRDKGRLRKLISAAGTILYDAYHGGGEDTESVQLVLERAEQAVFQVAREEGTSDPQRLAELLHHELMRLEELDGEGISGIATGYHDLDEKLSGLHAGEMLIVAARPSMGKTALALNLAEQIALGGAAPGEATGKKKETIPVGLFSLEMSREAIVQRLVSAKSGVDSHKIRTGRISDGDHGRIVKACSELSEATIIIDDTPSLTILGLRARARRMVAQDHVKVIMIDYLQLLTSPGAARESRQVEVSTISRGIKALARELEVPVVCLAQLNRGSEQREGHRPRMSDLRESGSIEQDADVVMLLHRESYYHVGDDNWMAENAETVNDAELIVAKQRNGPTGTVHLTWDSNTTRFKNPSKTPGGYAGGGAYANPFGASTYQEPKPGGAPPFQAGSAFGGRAKTGPAENHRDGGGSDNRPDDIGDLPV